MDGDNSNSHCKSGLVRSIFCARFWIEEILELFHISRPFSVTGNHGLRDISICGKYTIVYCSAVIKLYIFL
jgi:hypothetical protein